MSAANPSSRLGTAPTARELEVLGAYLEHGSYTKTARALGITKDGVDALLANLRARTGVARTRDAAVEYPNTVVARSVK